MDLDGERRSLEVAAHPVGDVLQIAGQSRALVGPDIVPRAEAEPLRPWRGEFGEQAGGQLLHCVWRRAVEQPVGVAAGLPKLAAEPDALLRQRVGVAFTPKGLPRLAALAHPFEAVADHCGRESC